MHAFCARVVMEEVKKQIKDILKRAGEIRRKFIPQLSEKLRIVFAKVESTYAINELNIFPEPAHR